MTEHERRIENLPALSAEALVAYERALDFATASVAMIDAARDRPLDTTDRDEKLAALRAALVAIPGGRLRTAMENAA